MPDEPKKDSLEKEWYKNGWGILVALIFLPFFAIWYVWAKTSWGEAQKSIVTTIIVIVMIAMAGGESQTDTKTTVPAPEQPTAQQTETKATDEQKPEPVKATPEPEVTDPIKRIEADINKVSDKFEITVWDTKGDFAKSTSVPPYEIVINAGNGDISNCSSAKNVSFQIMKAVYSDEQLKDKVSRILFTSWGHLRVSLGSEDGSKLDWGMAGPTNFWKVMMEVRPYENEIGETNQRTWGKFIGSDCK